MNCKEARRRMAEVVFEGGDPPEDLRAHLRSCPRCARRFPVYRCIEEELGGLEGFEVPEPVREVLEERLEAVVAEEPQPDLVPARPDPERPGSHKAAAVIGGMLFLIAVAVLAIALAGPTYEEVPGAARAVRTRGNVAVQSAAMGGRRPLEEAAVLMPGDVVRTDRSGIAKLTADGMQWCVDGRSAAGFYGSGAAELVVGRMYAACDGSTEESMVVVAGPATVTCGRGSVVVSVFGKRARVGCASGSATVRIGEEELNLEVGDYAMVAGESAVNPVRRVRPAELTHWLNGFAAGGADGLSQHGLASVPLRRPEPILPKSVSIERLDVKITLRGPLAFVRARARLRNDGPADWQGAIDPADVTLPGPLASAEGRVRLAAGDAASCEAVAVYLLVRRENRFALGLNPGNWTGRPIGTLSVQVEGTASGGFRSFRCSAGGDRIKRKKAVEWSLTEESWPASRPLVVEFQPADKEGVDTMRLGEAPDSAVLAAWRPDAARRRWFDADSRLLIAFDATADFGPGGRAYAHEVMETVMRALPSGCSTALAAYDGELKMDGAPLSRHLVGRVERLLAALWTLEGESDAGDGGLLRQALALCSGAPEPMLLLYVTGRGEPSAQAEAELAIPSDVRPVVLQVGSDRAEPLWQEFCARRNGVSVALPAAMAPRLATMDFLGDMRWPALREARVGVAGGGRAVLLRRRTVSAGQPVAALIRPADGPLRATFSGRAGEERLTREVAVEPGPPDCRGELLGRLIEGLEDRVPAR